METKTYYHCANNGFKSTSLFLNSTEFVAGMNRIGICYLLLEGRIQVIAFCLMDNHVHFLLQGTKTDCELFLNHYKRLTEIWIKNHRENDSKERKWEFGIWPLRYKEKVMDTIAYIHRNPTAAKFPYTPEGYSWSSAFLYFSDNYRSALSGKAIGTLSAYQQRNIFSSRMQFPEDWIVLHNGEIWPGCYTKSDIGMSFFPSPKAYQYQQNTNVEDDINKEIQSNTFSLPDGDILEFYKTKSIEFYGIEDYRLLSTEQRIALARLCVKEMGANIKQAARICGLKSAESIRHTKNHQSQ